MIIKCFNLNDLKKNSSNFFLFYGVNEGHKEEIINDLFLNNFKGEIIRYDENQILENKNIFFEACLNESLFDTEKIILISQVTSKLYEIIKEKGRARLGTGQGAIGNCCGYLDWHVGNNIVLVPIFGDQNDERAISIISEHFPKREIITLDGRLLLEGGGGIHCVTKERHSFF